LVKLAFYFLFLFSVQFFGVPLFRNIVMKCLTEIGSLNVGNVYDEQFRYLFVGSLEKLSTFLPLDFSLAKAYENGTDEENRFIQDLGLFLSGFMREHSRVRLEEKANLRPNVV